MSKKFSAQRKRAFLTYLAQTGNQTLSAERAKVSRSWVCLHRAEDAAFDAACRAAIAEAALRLRSSAGSAGDQDERVGHTPHPPTASAAGPSLSLEGRGAESCRPPSGWGYLDGTELVVAGSNRRHAQVRRARVKQWTARVEKRFLSVLAATCNVKAACSAVGMWPQSAYNHRRRWPAFASAWAKAEKIAYLRLEAGLIAAACNLGEEPEFEPDLPIEGMTVWHAMQLLFMHRHQVRGVGGRPGRAPRSRLASDAEMIKALSRSLRQFGVDDEELKKALAAPEEPPSRMH